VKSAASTPAESGEYHTMVLDMPQFKMPIKIEGFESGRRGPLLYIKPKKMSLELKNFPSS
jgi:diphthamide synthase (EF-2-diphthine--ammonia ligase)